jgi:hypothetical protein
LSSHFNISTDAGLFPNVNKFLAAGEYQKRARKGKSQEIIRSSRLYKSSGSGWPSGHTTHE